MSTKDATDEKTKAFHPSKSVFQFESEKKFDGKSIEKELVPWDSNGSEMDIELDGKTGWDVNEMFKQNEKKYGVRTNFDPELKSYTLPLKKAEGKDYRDAEAEAGKLAQEIENNVSHKVRLSSENTEDDDVKGLE